MAVEGGFDLVAEFVDARGEVVFYRPQLPGQVNPWADVLGLLDGVENEIDNFWDFCGGIHLAEAWAIVGGKGSFGNYDPVPVAKLVHLPRDRGLPVVWIRQRAATYRQQDSDHGEG